MINILLLELFLDVKMYVDECIFFFEELNTSSLNYNNDTNLVPSRKRSTCSRDEFKIIVTLFIENTL